MVFSENCVSAIPLVWMTKGNYSSAREEVVTHVHIHICRMDFSLKIVNCEFFVVSQLKEAHCLHMHMHIHVHAGWHTLFKHVFSL